MGSQRAYCPKVTFIYILTNRLYLRSNVCTRLAEIELPYKLLARSGVSDMLAVGGDKVGRSEFIYMAHTYVKCGYI